MKVSVFVQTYNHSLFVAQALHSVLMQETDFPIEIIVLDDASSDDTQQIIYRYANAHPGRFRIIFNEENLGSGAAGNAKWWKTLQSAAGQYVALLEGDDYWTDRKKLQKQVAFMDTHPDFVLCGHDNVIRNEWSGTELPRNRFTADFTASMEQLLVGNTLHTGSLLLRNGILLELPSCFADAEATDWPLQIMLAERGGVRVLSDSMSMYRIHTGGAWSGKYRVPSKTGMPGIKPEAWRAIIRTWELLDRHLNYQYQDHIREMIARARQEIARLESGRALEQ
jgi:glycosyltransferase involved in cell wall biosynthesis